MHPSKSSNASNVSQLSLAAVEELCEQLRQENQSLKKRLEDTGMHDSSIDTPTNFDAAQKDETGPTEAPVSLLTPLQLLTVNIKDGFISVDKGWMIIQHNPQAAQLLSLPGKQLIGRSLPDVFAQEINSNLPFNPQRITEEHPSKMFEHWHQPAQAWLEINIYPTSEGAAIFIKDITQRKQDEADLRARNERHDLVAKATNDSIWDWDFKTGQVTRPGNLLETFFGHDPLEPGEVDAFWNTHAHPEDWQRINQRRNLLLADPTVNYWEDDYRFLNSAGRYAYVHDRGYIIRDDTGKAIRMIGASQDITNEKEQVNEVVRLQQNFESLINSTTDPIWSIDTSMHIIAANTAYKELAERITERQIREGEAAMTQLPGVHETYNWEPLYRRALAGECFNIDQSILISPTSEPLHMVVSFLPIRDTGGVVTGVACYQKNVTELKQAGEQLQQLNESLAKRAEELVASNTELEKFAYVASHDLQEPLRMVTGFLQLIEKKYKGQIDETASRYIHFAVDGAERMKHLINDLLQYSRAGTAVLENQPVAMNDVLKDVLLIFQHDFDTAGVTIVTGKLPVIDAGRSAMTQLLQNLVGNALKYRQANEPFIKVSAEELDSAWAFTVADNGIGIEEKFLEKIFVVFQRLHNKDEYSGTGIGLAICKKIVERYQGKIWVESSVGKGSKFIFTIPKKIVPN